MRSSHSWPPPHNNWARQRRSRRRCRCLDSCRSPHSSWCSSGGMSATRVAQNSGHRHLVAPHTCACCWAWEPAPIAWKSPTVGGRCWRCARCDGTWHDDSGTRPAIGELLSIKIHSLIHRLTLIRFTCTRASLKCTLVASSSRTNASG